MKIKISKVVDTPVTTAVVPMRNNVIPIQAQNEYLIARSRLMNAMTDPRRNIDQECGYPEDEPPISLYRAMFDRQDIAARVISVFPDECWAVYPEVYEKEEPEITPFEEAWDTLLFEKNIWHYLHLVDVLSGVGHFGTILLGFDDKKDLSEPVPGCSEDGSFTLGKKKLNLLYIRVFDEMVCKIAEYQNENGPRFGQPLYYEIQLAEQLADSPAAPPPPSKLQRVHWSRIIHVADNTKNSETHGSPRLRNVLNRLLDLKKVLGGSAEMFWKGAFPGFSIETLPEVLNQSDTEVDADSIREQFFLMMNGLQRYIALNGMKATSLAPQVADPTAHVVQQIQAICITLGVPYRIFLGSESAHLASTQDSSTWNKRVAMRQMVYINPMIINPFVRRMMDVGVLPRVKRWHVSWTDLNALSDKDRADVSLKKTQALMQYVTGGGETICPQIHFWTTIMSEPRDVAEAIVADNKKASKGKMDTKAVWDQPAAGAFGNTAKKPATNSLGGKTNSAKRKA